MIQYELTIERSALALAITIREKEGYTVGEVRCGKEG